MHRHDVNARINVSDLTLRESKSSGVSGGSGASMDLANVSVENSGGAGVYVWSTKRNTMKNCNRTITGLLAKSEQINCIMVGPSKVGKTTILYTLLLNETNKTWTATNAYNYEVIQRVSRVNRQRYRIDRNEIDQLHKQHNLDQHQHRVHQ